MKRNCRRTEDEKKIHDKAVKMRNMTDEQLVHYVEDREEKARSEGRNEAKKEKATVQAKNVGQFLEYISQNPVKGIGCATVSKLMKVAKEHGFCA